MPHIIVEYSTPQPDLNVKKLLNDLHQGLATEQGVDIARIKTRAIPLNDFVVGGENEPNAMIHITLKIMPGRPVEIQKQMIQKLFNIARTHTPDGIVTAETMELIAETYCR